MEPVLEDLNTDWIKTKGEPPAWIWARHQEWAMARDKEENRYGSRHVDTITDHIASLIPPITTEQKRNLNGQVYNCNRWEERVRKEEARKAMIAQGWEVLSVEIVQRAFSQGKKLKVLQRGYNLLLDQVEQSSVMKPLVNERGVYLMTLRSRTKGYDVRGLCAHSHNEWYVQLI